MQSWWCLPSMHMFRAWSPAPHKLGVVAHACNPKMLEEAEVEASWATKEFKGSLS